MEQPTGLDLAVLFAGVIATILLGGTILLAFVGRTVPPVVENGDLAALGFFFTKGVASTIETIVQKRKEGATTGDKMP